METIATMLRNCLQLFAQENNPNFHEKDEFCCEKSEKSEKIWAQNRWKILVFDLKFSFFRFLTMKNGFSGAIHVYDRGLGRFPSTGFLFFKNYRIFAKFLKEKVKKAWFFFFVVALFFSFQKKKCISRTSETHSAVKFQPSSTPRNMQTKTGRTNGRTNERTYFFLVSKSTFD